jgi:hypothetical protein
VNALALVLNVKCRKLGCLEWWWLGVFIALNHQLTVGAGCCRWAHRTVRCATRHCPVCQPRHPTVRVRELLTLEALSSSGTGQALFTVQCTFDECSNFCTHCSRTVALRPRFCSRPLRWIAVTPLVHGQSGGTPDSPMNYSGARSKKPESGQFTLVRTWCTGHCSVAHQTVRCARPGHTRFLAPFKFEPFLQSFIGLC